MQVTTELVRRFTIFCLEQANKKAGIAKARLEGDLCNGHRRCAQQSPRILKPQLVAIRAQAHTHAMLEQMADMGSASVKMRAKLTQRDRGMVFLQKQ